MSTAELSAGVGYGGELVYPRFELALSGIQARPEYNGFARMDVRSYVDPETHEPHICKHGVTEDEVTDVLRSPGEDRPGREGARIAIGQTRSGRYLRVVYVPEPGGIFVITAYELRGKALMAYRRRRRRKGRR